jgi:hypothetical protein
MKILFHLSAVTPWWFETVIAPMLRALHDEAELHVIVGPLWQNTALETEHVEPLADLERINWHIVCADDPHRFRMDGQSVDGLLDLAESIAPDITIARSADRVTPGLFPGAVLYITEPGAEPGQCAAPLVRARRAPLPSWHHARSCRRPGGSRSRADGPLWQTLDML